MRKIVRVNLERGQSHGVTDPSQVGYSIVRLTGAVTIDIDGTLYRVRDRLTEKQATRLTEDKGCEVIVTAK